MEFKSLRNIESSFRQIRLFGIVFLSLCAVVTVWSVWNSYRFAEKQREKIYGGNRIDFPYRRIVSLKTDILIRESFLLELNFSLFHGKI